MCTQSAHRSVGPWSRLPKLGPTGGHAATRRGAPAGALPADGFHDPRPRQHPLACRRDAHMGPGRYADPCEMQKRVRSPLLGSQHCL